MKPLRAQVVYALLGVLFASSYATAQEQSLAVGLSLSDCPSVSEGALIALFRLEMQTNGTEVLTPPLPEDRTLTLADVECTQDTRLRMTITDPLTAKTVIRDVNLADHAEGMQPRIIALALAELVVVSWSELATNPSPVTPPPATAALATQAIEAAEERLTLPEAPSRLGGSAQVGFMTFLSDNTSQAARGAASLFVGMSEEWLLELQVGGSLHFPYEGALGSISSRSVELSLLTHWQTKSTNWRSSLGFGATMGIITMQGIPTGATTQSAEHTGLWAGPTLNACGGVRLGPAARGTVSLCALAGWALISTVGLEDDVSAVRIGGPFLGASLHGSVIP